MKLLSVLLPVFLFFSTSPAEGSRVIHSSAIKAFTIFLKDPHPYFANVVDCRNVGSTSQTLKVGSEEGSNIFMWANGVTPLPAIGFATGTSEVVIPAGRSANIRFNLMCNEKKECQFSGLGSNDPAVTPVALDRLDVEVVQYLKLEVKEDIGAIQCRVTAYVFGDTTTFIEKIRASNFELNGGRPF